MTKRSARFENVAHAGFFVLRTPLLPFDELLAWADGLTARQLWESGSSIETAWAADVQLLRDRLRKIIDRPEIAHALFIASPSLQSGIKHWKRNADSKKGLQAEHALVRYYARMCGRSTPFGLFSGCSVGQVVDSTHAGAVLALESRDRYRPVSRLDFDYLFALTSALGQDASVAMQMRYWPDSSLFKIGNVWHYVESRVAGAARKQHLVKVESDMFLEEVLEGAKAGATISDLTQLLQAKDHEVSEEEAQQYIQELIARNMLVSSFVPRVTGDPLDDLIAQCESTPVLSQSGEILKSVRLAMEEQDRKGVSVSPEAYRAIASTLEALPAKFDPAYLYQVDLNKPVQAAILTRPIVDELILGIQVVHRLIETVEPDPLSSFREAFTRRYEQAVAPLLEVLDTEVGIGFGTSGAESSPLLRGLGLGGGRPARRPDGFARGNSLNACHSLLLRKLVHCAQDGKSGIELEAADLPTDTLNIRTLPNSFAVHAKLIAESMSAVQEGRFELELRGGTGPNGANLFGRFCHIDPQLEEYVRKYVRQEEAHDPDSVYAEIVYLPQGRIGNVLCRPVFRDYEIVYLGRSGAPQDGQIPASDLLVGVEAGQIVLFSQRLGRRIIPRLTNAHGFANPQLSPVYRFLCMLQHQHGVSGLRFQWGPLETLDYLPNVRMGRLILATARWRLAQKEIQKIAEAKGRGCFAAVQEVRDKLRLPRWVLFEESDNTLPVDLDNPLSVDAFAHVLKRAQQAVLREMTPAPDRLCVAGPEGRFCHELHVPFVRVPNVEKFKSGALSRIHGASISRAVRAPTPGSEWLYVKLYGGGDVLDDALLSLCSLLRSSLNTGSIKKWFFVRYSDPERHLRIRFNGDAARMTQELLPALHQVLNSFMLVGRAWKLQLDTYDREIERYGGLEGMEAAEDIFFADSAAVLELLELLHGDEGMEYRWRIALVSIDSMLSDFGLNLAAKTATVKRFMEGLYQQFNVEQNLKRGLGDRFRAERENVKTLLEVPAPVASVFELARKVLDRRSIRIRATADQLQPLWNSGTLKVSIPDLITSYVHMHVNRLIRSSPNRHELVLYDFLFRMYNGKMAQVQRSSGSLVTHEGVAL